MTWEGVANHATSVESAFTVMLTAKGLVLKEWRLTHDGKPAVLYRRVAEYESVFQRGLVEFTAMPKIRGGGLP